MPPYLSLLRHLLDHGEPKDDRTGTGTLSTFGYQMRFPLNEGFPLLTTKKLHVKSIVHELLWFLRGDTNAKSLNDVGVRIWDEWADPDTGDLGPIYGKQWRSWPDRDGGTIDQLGNVIQTLRSDPDSRRMIVSAWNVGQLDEMALPPCHAMFQFYSVERGGQRYLSCQLYQRSADVFLGVPFNIASYALLTHMVAHLVGMVPREFVHTLGDAHLYRNHIDQAREQLSRPPHPLPTLRIQTGDREVSRAEDFRFEDVILEGYDPHPHIAAKVAV